MLSNVVNDNEIYQFIIFLKQRLAIQDALAASGKENFSTIYWYSYPFIECVILHAKHSFIIRADVNIPLTPIFTPIGVAKLEPSYPQSSNSVGTKYSTKITHNAIKTVKIRLFDFLTHFLAITIWVKTLLSLLTL